MQRGHARDGRKFKQSLMWLIGETSRQNSGNQASREGCFDFLWEREQSPCEAPVDNLNRIGVGKDAAGSGVGAGGKC